MRRPSPNFAAGRSYVPVIAFLVGSAVLVVFVCYNFLFPAMQAASGIDESGQKELSAISLLVLALVLVCLLILLLLTFRPGRLFLPRQREPRTRTRYVDAWEESARRMQTPPDDEDQGQ